MLQSGDTTTTAVVRARITMTMDNMVALRDLLARVIKTQGIGPAPTATSGGTRH
jgi:hypothetical protein